MQGTATRLRHPQVRRLDRAVPPGPVATLAQAERPRYSALSRPSQDGEAEIARLVDISATIIDGGQPADATWTVLADPDGNEFCVLSARIGNGTAPGGGGRR